jgi:hypothetical protein
VQSGDCDVAIGSRFLPESGQDGTPQARARARAGHVAAAAAAAAAISDGTSGLYAVNRNALALLADRYVCEAPGVEALVRITDARLRLVEVPVHMRQREHGESSFRGKRAVELVVTIGLTLPTRG